jgi:NAD(P)-dependent dehydrogenase (short-subunit alcohol dehydrogenase family)
MRRLDGKKVVVVGAGQAPGDVYGNGHAIAALMGREGAEVFAVDFVAERAESTAAEIRREGGVAHALAADVGRSDECTRLVDAVVATMGGVACS